MDTDLISKTEDFLKYTFEHSEYFRAHKNELDYRLEHSYRVANIGKRIAISESLDRTKVIIACLLHDIAYCNEMSTREERLEHGRASAKIARPFLESLGLSSDDVNDICYAIAIHVDDKADFEWQRTVFSETVGDADNIDRFDAYRIYESLQYKKFSEMTIFEKKDTLSKTIEHLKELYKMKLGTKTAVMLWQRRVGFYIDFYERLEKQFDESTSII